MQREEYQRLLEPVIERLNSSLTGFKYDKKSLSLLLTGFQQFLETAFGINVSGGGGGVGWGARPLLRRNQPVRSF